MTNREIKFELAKIALVQCVSIDSVKQMYEWIVEEPEVDIDKPKTDYDKTSVREIIKYLVNNDRYSDKRYATSLAKVFSDNIIYTVGDILRLGRRKFRRINSIGKGSVTRIDDALDELYGIKNW